MLRACHALVPQALSLQQSGQSCGSERRSPRVALVDCNGPQDSRSPPDVLYAATRGAREQGGPCVEALQQPSASRQEMSQRREHVIICSNIGPRARVATSFASAVFFSNKRGKKEETQILREYMMINSACTYCFLLRRRAAASWVLTRGRADVPQKNGRRSPGASSGGGGAYRHFSPPQQPPAHSYFEAPPLAGQ